LPTPTTEYNLPGVGEGSIPTPKPIVPKTNYEDFMGKAKPVVKQGLDTAYSTTPMGQLDTVGKLGTKVWDQATGAFNKWASAPALSDEFEGVKQEDACDKFMRKHTSEEEMLNDAIPKKKSPPPEDLNEDKMLLTSSACKK
jgi:hypothetical protein